MDRNTLRFVLSVLTVAVVGVSWYSIHEEQPEMETFVLSDQSGVISAAVEPTVQEVVEPRLTGIVLALKQQDSLAMLALPNQQAEALHSGDSIGDWRVGKIDSATVELIGAAGRRLISISESPASGVGEAHAKSDPGVIPPSKTSTGPFKTPPGYPGPIVQGVPGVD